MHETGRYAVEIRAALQLRRGRGADVGNEGGAGLARTAIGVGRAGGRGDHDARAPLGHAPDPVGLPRARGVAVLGDVRVRAPPRGASGDAALEDRFGDVEYVIPAAPTAGDHRSAAVVVRPQGAVGVGDAVRGDLPSERLLARLRRVGPDTRVSAAGRSRGARGTADAEHAGAAAGTTAAAATAAGTTAAGTPPRHRCRSARSRRCRRNQPMPSRRRRGSQPTRPGAASRALRRPAATVLLADGHLLRTCRQRHGGRDGGEPPRQPDTRRFAIRHGELHVP